MEEFIFDDSFAWHAFKADFNSAMDKAELEITKVSRDLSRNEVRQAIWKLLKEYYGENK